MTRDTTIEKKQIVLKTFHELLRSGNDYEVAHMYREAGKPVFLAGIRAGGIIRDYYHTVITEEMIDFIPKFNRNNKCEIINTFAQKFGFCEREARLIIRYIRRKK
jgi:hypothetical protein